MVAARDSVRVHLAKQKHLQLAQEAFAADVAGGAFDGSYYRVLPEITKEPDGRLRLKAVSVSNRLEVGTMSFDINTGDSNIEWHDSDPDED
jgi:hypothetical protein